MRDRLCGLLLLGPPALALAACAPAAPQLRQQLRATQASLAPLPTDASPKEAPTFGGTLSGYLAYAYANSPALRASFETWRAATHRPDQERRLPEPTLTYAGFIRSVETRVGPQRHRFSASQWFPWPTKLRAGSDAAVLEAQAAQRRFEGHALHIAADVAAAYWRLWNVHRQTEVARDEVAVLESLSEQVRVRVEVGVAELSDLAQINLMLSRARDRQAGLTQHQRIGNAQLVGVLGAPDGIATPISDLEPKVVAVAESAAELSAAASRHPEVQSLATLSDAASERAREARADRAPSFGLGVDWILTGSSKATPEPVDSGKDAVAMSLSVKVPLWSRAYQAAEQEEHARGRALRAQALDARNTVAAQVREQAARIDDDVRRVRVYESTLLPQAEAAFESVLASYASGRSTVAELLLAERALLSLREERFTAQADYGTDLARLERALGRPVQLKAAVDQEDPHDDAR
ncbi:MAG: TolC family protein [Nannocystaceae bacterium]|nr:TolC family protein [Nannocystaceae bacterium]